MRRPMLPILPALAILLALTGATVGGDIVPQCGGPFQLCGYAERGSDVMRIPLRFEVAAPFSEGLAAVRIDGLYGFVDERGTMVVPARYRAVGSFSGGYAEIWTEDAAGIIDRSGRLVIPPRFQRIFHLDGATFIAVPLRTDANSEPPPDYSLENISGLSVLLGLGGAGLYHPDTGWLTTQNLQFSMFDEPSRGLIWAAPRERDGEPLWGLMRADGSWQITPRYEHVQRMSETHAVVRAATDSSLPVQQRRESVRWGAVDRNGQLIVPLAFAHLSYWRAGYGYAKEGGPYVSSGVATDVREAIVQADGSLLADRYFDEVDIRTDGLLPRGRIGTAWYSVQSDGQLSADELDGRPLVACDNGLTILHRGDRVEFIRSGDGRSLGRFDASTYSARDCPGPFSARRGSKWYIVAANVSVLGGADGFENMFMFQGDHAAVRVGGYWGIIDRSGAFSVEPTYPILRPYGLGIFAVGDGAATRWIDARGNAVTPPPTTGSGPRRSLTCEGGLRLFKRGENWGLQDGSGTTVIEPVYRALSCFERGVTWTVRSGDAAWCPIGPDGRRRDALGCRPTYFAYTQTHSVPEAFAADPFESNILWNRAWLDYRAGERAEPPKWVGRFATES